MAIEQSALIQAHQAALLATIEGYGRTKLPEPIRQAFLRVPRHLFLERYREYGNPEWQNVEEASLWKHLPVLYRDGGVGIYGEDDDDVVATISHPWLVLRMLDELAIAPGMRVLEIGTGSGWNAGLLGALVGPAGAVDTVEIIPELVPRAERALARAGITNVRVLLGDAAELKAAARYDRVVFTAASYDIPRVVHEVLEEGGILEHVLKCQGGGSVLLLLRKRGRSLVSRSAHPCEFVPLTGRDRLRQLDARALEAFEPWSRVRGRTLRQRPFWLGDRDPMRFVSKTFALRTYLAVVEPQMRWFNGAFGLWDEEGDSLALVEDGRVAVYGGATAGDRLEAHLDRWSALGMPSMLTMPLRAQPADPTFRPGPREAVVSRPSTDFVWRLD